MNKRAKPNHLLSKHASLQLNDILTYTAKNFGTQKAIEYGQKRQQGMQTIAELKHIGLIDEMLPDGVFYFPIKEHYLFFRRVNEGIEIIQILHKRRDFLRHF